MSAKDTKEKFRMITYLSPTTISLGLLDLFRDLLESELGVHVYIIYESRWSGPPADRPDPFTMGDVEMGFMCSSAYLRMVHDQIKSIELCHAAPVYNLPKTNGRPFYYSDVVINASDRDKYKDFHALQGCNWAYNDDMSLSGNLVVLAELRKLGLNASFFGNIIQSGSHQKSLDMIVEHEVDAAAVDTNVLVNYRRQYPHRAEQLETLTSFGPLPIQPIIFNSSLPAATKEKITQLLLGLHTNTKWCDRLRSFGVIKFTQIDESLYKLEQDVTELVKGLSIQPPYY